MGRGGMYLNAGLLFYLTDGPTGATAEQSAPWMEPPWRWGMGSSYEETSHTQPRSSHSTHSRTRMALISSGGEVTGETKTGNKASVVKVLVLRCRM